MTMQRVLENAAEDCSFSGVARVIKAGSTVGEVCAGHADLAAGALIDPSTTFGIASGTKGVTAVAAGSLIDAGLLDWSTRVLDVIPELHNIDASVTVQHLLSHRSGVGDYLDEETLGDIDEEVLSIPPEQLLGPFDYVPMVAEPEHREVPGEVFRYNNGGFLMASMVVERVAGRPFHEVVHERVLEPAGMTGAGLFVSDRLPPGSARGYLLDGRTNIAHLPFRGAGDGGLIASASDIEAFWDALLGQRLLSPETTTFMIREHSAQVDGDRGYGLGFWLDPSRGFVQLEGMDAGVSFFSAVEHVTGDTFVVLSNRSGDAWPMVRAIAGAWSSGAWSSGAWSSGAWSSGAWSSGAGSSGAWSSGAWSSEAGSSGAGSSGAAFSSDVPGVVVRLASVADVEAIEACVHAAYGPYVELMDTPPAPMLDDYSSLVGDRVVSVATVDGHLVGAIVMWAESDHWYIDNIAVDPGKQGEGIGTTLLSWAGHCARGAGRSELRLYTNEAMVDSAAYYPRRGFTETHRAVEHGYNRIYFTTDVGAGPAG